MQSEQSFSEWKFFCMKNPIFLPFQRHFTSLRTVTSISRVSKISQSSSYHVEFCKRIISTINWSSNKPFISFFYICFQHHDDEDDEKLIELIFEVSHPFFNESVFHTFLKDPSRSTWMTSSESCRVSLYWLNWRQREIRLSADLLGDNQKTWKKGRKFFVINFLHITMSECEMDVNLFIYKQRILALKKLKKKVSTFGVFLVASSLFPGVAQIENS